MGKYHIRNCGRKRGGIWLPGLEFLDSSAPFLEKNAVTAVRAPDVNIDLDLLFAPGTLVGTWHIRSGLFGFFFNGRAVDSSQCNPEGRRLGLVCAARELVPAFPAFPDTRTCPPDGYHVALRAAVGGPGDLLHLCDSLAHEPPVPAAETPCTSGNFSFC